MAEEHSPGPLGPPPEYGESRVGWVPDHKAPPPVDWDRYRAAQVQPQRPARPLVGKNTRTAGYIVVLTALLSFAAFGLLRDYFVTDGDDATPFTAAYLAVAALQLLLGVGLVLRIPWVRIVGIVVFSIQIAASIVMMLTGVGLGGFLIPAVILYFLISDRPDRGYGY